MQNLYVAEPTGEHAAARRAEDGGGRTDGRATPSVRPTGAPRPRSPPDDEARDAAGLRGEDARSRSENPIVAVVADEQHRQ